MIILNRIRFALLLKNKFIIEKKVTDGKIMNKGPSIYSDGSPNLLKELCLYTFQSCFFDYMGTMLNFLAILKLFNICILNKRLCRWTGSKQRFVDYLSEPLTKLILANNHASPKFFSTLLSDEIEEVGLEQVFFYTFNWICQILVPEKFLLVTF